jgi:hypothetical protein
MDNLTYHAYLANPEIRVRIEREARHARAEAVHQYFAALLARVVQRTRAARESPAHRRAHCCCMPISRPGSAAYKGP